MDENQTQSVSTKEPTDPNIVKLKSGLKVNITAKTHSGLLSSIVFPGKAYSNGWKILKIANINCCGILPEPCVGGFYKLIGVFKENKKYNTWDFHFESYESIVDAGRGLKEYLFRECKGIGHTLARDIVGRFGNDTLTVLRTYPEKLAEIKGITKEKAELIQNWAKSEYVNSKFKERLYAIGLLPGQVSKLITHYGQDAENKIRTDCFSLTEIKGFGFKTTSAIADLIGIPATNPGRIKAAVIYALEQITQQGHTCIQVSEITREACALLSLQQSYIEPVINQMLKDGELYSEETDFHKLVTEKGLLLS